MSMDFAKNLQGKSLVTVKNYLPKPDLPYLLLTFHTYMNEKENTQNSAGIHKD
jgi:hypothetical protein